VKAEPADLQSAPFGHLGTRPDFWPRSWRRVGEYTGGRGSDARGRATKRRLGLGSCDRLRVGFSRSKSSWPDARNSNKIHTSASQRLLHLATVVRLKIGFYGYNLFEAVGRSGFGVRRGLPLAVQRVSGGSSELLPSYFLRCQQDFWRRFSCDWRNQSSNRALHASTCRIRNCPRTPIRIADLATTEGNQPEGHRQSAGILKYRQAHRPHLSPSGHRVATIGDRGPRVGFRVGR
jgi:hypothetical protein